ncbi:prepilin peptidase [Microbacterium aquimaris]|uniref:A24 family peptidase n=1 Tax=Microbacterium aquimaris TaxID=459816 RepID=A0ABU5N970_9MICO|nr:A24 family peptidase [Microbacterium aquimaris]MDZ8162625.1 A24 family peptidase [Microbacterium aquimaris]
MDVEPAIALARGASVAAYVAFAGISVVLAVIDARSHRLPNRIVAAGYALATVTLGLSAVAGGDGAEAIRALAAGAALFGALLLVRILDPRAIGGGDVKLAGLIGIHLGWLGWDAVLLGVALAFAGAGVFALLLVVARRRGGAARIAFGPWLLGGTWAAILLAIAPAVTG